MKKLSTLILFCFALALFAPLVVSVNAISTNIVISEFRVRGPNGGSDEFVELYNLSSGPVNIGGWKLRGSNAAGTVGDRSTIPAGVILNPGCFYLFTNSSTSGGPYSGSVLGDRTYSTGITDDGGLAITLADNTVIDQAGMSAGSAFKEGTPLASLGSTTASNLNRGYERKPGGTAGHNDTDNNATDFQLLTPSNPQNSSSACLGGTDPSIDGAATPNPVVQFDPVLITGAVAPGSSPTSTGLAATADLAVLGGANGQTLFDDGTNGDATAGDRIFSYLLAAVTAAPGTYTVNVQAVDAQARSGSDSFTVTVTAPPIIYLPHEIQGTGTTSPFNTQVVTVEGVVTGRRSNGVFIQTEAGREDAFATTSEGLFVFTSSVPPPAATVGTLVRATGEVQEFSGDGAGLTQTELADSPSIVTMGPGSIPAATPLTTADLSPGGGLDQLEHLEGMRIFAASLTTVAGTEGFFASGTGGEASGIATSNGVFYAVLTGTPRPLREAGIALPFHPAFANLCEAGPPCAIPEFDTNPERLRVDSDALGAPRLDVTSGVVITGMTAIVDSGFLTWNLLPVPAALPAPVVGPNAVPLGVAAPTTGQYTVASFNMQRFFDTVNDSDISDVPLTAANYANRLAKASLVIRTALQMPDILGVQEVENLGVLQDVAARINLDAGIPGEYTAYLEEGNDPGGIDVGFLVRSRVNVASVTQEGKNATFVDPDDASVDLLNDRPPLVLRATVDGPPTMHDATVIVVANHLRSLNGVESLTDNRVRAKRQKQAEFLATLLDGLQDEGPVISVGDYNAFEVNDGFVDVLGTILGTPAQDDQVLRASPDLVDPNLLQTSPGVYSYVFEGSAQTLDHVLISSGAQTHFVGLQHARVNADFPEVYRHDATRVERLSDHDPAVAFFGFPPDVTPPDIDSVTPSVASLWPPNHRMVAIGVSVEAGDDLGLAQCAVTSVSSNEPVDGLGDGDTAPDWTIDGPFAVQLRAERGGGGSGRIYTISVSCEDVAGNVSVATAEVTVPYSR